MKRSILACSLVGLFASSSAFAQEPGVAEYVPEGEIKQMENEKRQGLDGTLQVSANVNFVSNKSVVGQTDGLSMLFGIGLLSGLDYIHQRHEWRNTFQLNEAWSKTPVLNEFVKADDVASLESLYNYFLLSWFGLFGRVSAETALLRTWAVTAEPVDYAITNRDDETELREDVERLRLADPFQPLTLTQSIGAFAEPIQEPAINLSARLGFGLRETFANGVLVIQDDADTEGVIEVDDLTNPNTSVTVFQGGLEGFLGASGKFSNDRILYDFGLSALIPFLNNDPENRSATELTRVGVAASVGIGIFEWMSVNYKLRILRDPQLLDDLQVQNNLLLTFNYTFVERTEPDAPPEPTEAEKNAEEAERRAAEAEARAAELERELAAERAKVDPTPAAPNPAVTPDADPQPGGTPDDPQ